jgi:hypothetical protein
LQQGMLGEILVDLHAVQCRARRRALVVSRQEDDGAGADAATDGMACGPLSCRHKDATAGTMKVM